MVTFTFDIWYGRGELFFLHLTNIAIHILCFVSAIFLFYQLGVCTQRSDQTKEQIPVPWELGIWVAGIWALHPLQASAVTYLVQRIASLVALFFVLSTAAYVAARSEHVKNKSLSGKALVFYSCSFLCILLASLCKENAAMIPVMLFCAELWFFRPTLLRDIIGIIRKHWLLAGVIVIFSCIAAYNILPSLCVGYKTRHFSMAERLLTEPRIIIWYISALLYPNPTRLSLEHDIVISTSLFSPVSTAISIVVLCLLFIFSILKRREYPLITFGIAWFMINNLVESSFIPLELIFEHRMYLPSMGILLGIIVSGYSLFRHYSSQVTSKDVAIVSWSVVALLSATLTLCTFERNSSWQSALTLNRDNVTKAPNNPRAHANLASALATAGQYNEAIKEAEIAIGLGKKYYEQYCVAANTIITSYMSLGQYEMAVKEGERLLKERETTIDAGALPAMYLNMAQVYIKLGDYSEAFRSSREALKFNGLIDKPDPSETDICIDVVKSIVQMANSKGIDLWQHEASDLADLPDETRIVHILIEYGFRKKAIELLEKQIAANSNDVEGKFLLESLSKEDELNHLQKEKSDFTKKYVYQPFSRFNASMAGAFLIRSNQIPSPFSRLGEALLDYALEISPNSADAHLLKGWYHFARGEWEAGVAEAGRSIELDPEYAKAWLGMGFFLVKGNRSEDAIAAFRKSLDLYPGSPQRAAISGMIKGLEESRPTDVPAQAVYPSKGSDSAESNTGV
jgi:tetratricopeptide (TPR) repeat protein